LPALARRQDPGYRQSDGAMAQQTRNTIYKERWKGGRKERKKERKKEGKKERTI